MDNWILKAIIQINGCQLPTWEKKSIKLLNSQADAHVLKSNPRVKIPKRNLVLEEIKNGRVGGSLNARMNDLKRNIIVIRWKREWQ